MRITKDKETRRAELIDASAALFLEKGFDATMVSDIVKRVGVAQGTFYYYYPAKEDVLDDVLKKLLEEGVARAERLAQDETQTCAQRLEGLFRMLFSPRGSIEASSRYSQFLQDPSVRGRFEEVRFGILCPVFQSLLDAGVEAGEFRALRFGNELAEMALRGASALVHARQELMTQPMGADATMDALAELMEKLLGLPDQSLDFKDRIIRRHT